MIIKKFKDLLLFIILFIISGFCSINIGMDRDWDVRNYQIYSPWAFLNNRLTFDIMPAGIQSYFNPLIDIPYYLSIKYLNNHPYFVTFLMGFGCALLLFMTYKIAEIIFEKYSAKLIPLYCTILTAITSIVHKNIGLVSQDMFISALALISIFFIFKSLKNKDTELKYITFAGLIIGMACGLKLSATVYAIPIVLTTFIFAKYFQKPFKVCGMLILSAGITFLLFNGFWMYKLYLTYGNPFMPYFNGLFKSSYINADNVYAIDFQRVKIKPITYFIFPFTIQYEYWLKLLYSAFILNLLILPFINKKEFYKKYNIDIIYLKFLMIFLLLSYLYWTNLLLRRIRYIIYSAGLTPIISILFIFCFSFILSKIINKFKYKDIVIKNFIIISFIAIPIILNSMFDNNKKPLKRVKLKGNTEKILYIEDLNLPDGAIVITQAGSAIIAPFQNPSARYIYMNFTEHTKKHVKMFTEEYDKKIENILKSNRDKLYFIGYSNIEKHKDTTPESIEQILQKGKRKEIKALNLTHTAIYELDKYGFDINTANCNEIKTNIYITKFYVCKMELKNY